MFGRLWKFLEDVNKSAWDKDIEDRRANFEKKMDEFEASPRFNPLYPAKRGIANPSYHNVTTEIGGETFTDTVALDTSVELIGNITILSRDVYSDDLLNRRSKNNMRIKDLKNGDIFLEGGRTKYQAKSDPYLHRGYWHINRIELPEYEIVKKNNYNGPLPNKK